MSVRRSRMMHELKLLQRDPPLGISAYPIKDSVQQLEAQISGPADSPYANGVWRLHIAIPDRYPFEPPKIRFLTQIYHPNIDSEGRICLDTLKMPPQGSWRPSLNIPTVLTMIRLLISNPNPDDGLMADISEQFIRNREEFNATARRHCLKHAVQGRREAEEIEEENRKEGEEEEEVDSAATASGGQKGAVSVSSSVTPKKRPAEEAEAGVAAEEGTREEFAAGEEEEETVMRPSCPKRVKVSHGITLSSVQHHEHNVLSESEDDADDGGE